MSIKVISVTNDIKRAQSLINSLQRFGWDYAIIETEWKGFGTKLIATYNYLKTHPEVERFIFCDAHDVIVLGTEAEFEIKLEDKNSMLFNSERGCWPPPVQHFQYMYQEHPGGWQYLNSGVYYAPANLYKTLYEAYPPKFETDDQWLWSMIYLFGGRPVQLDTQCEVFQTYSFVQDDDFEYLPNTLYNKKTVTHPIFIHANGGGGMPKVLQLLEKI